jgi:hypothetical protein
LAEHSTTPLLDMIRLPHDLRQLQPEMLRQVADELRRETIDAVSMTGGHLGAGLATGSARSARAAVFPVLRAELKVSTTPSARLTRRPRFPLASVWQWPAILRERIFTLSA